MVVVTANVTNGAEVWVVDVIDVLGSPLYRDVGQVSSREDISYDPTHVYTA